MTLHTSQEGERDEQECSVQVLLLIHPDPTHGVTPPTPRVDGPISSKLNYTVSYRHYLKAYILGDSRSCQVDDQNQPSQVPLSSMFPEPQSGNWLVVTSPHVL